MSFTVKVIDLKFLYIVIKKLVGVCGVIEIRFREDEKKLGVLQRQIQKRRQRRYRCRQIYRELLQEEIIVMELPCTYEEGERLGREWFEQCLFRVRELYSRQLVYFTEEVCRKFHLAEYKKQWLCWYCLFPELWEASMERLGLDSRSVDVVYVDNGQKIDPYFVREIALRVRRMLIITKRRECWQELSEQLSEETGMFLELQEEFDAICRERVIVDFCGTYLSKYPKWAEENWVIAWGMNGYQREHLQSRTRQKRVVDGFSQSIRGEKISSRMAAVYMQSQHWKLRELADTQESCWRWEELEKIRENYDWKLEAVEVV